MSKVIILFHGNCMDGTGAKFAAWMKYQDTAKYIPVQYGQPMPDLGNDPDTELYILDFSYPKEVVKELQAKFKKVVILDHHKTAEADLKELVSENIVFDMNRSGAMMAWQYFHPDLSAPELIKHIQDRDLWKFELADTKCVHAGLGLLKGNMNAWKNYADPRINEKDDYGYLPEAYMPQLIASGKSILTYEQQQLDAAVPKKVKVINFYGYKAGIINSGYLVSETGTAIYESKDLNVDIAIMYFIGTDNVVYLSFRSKKGSNVDVAEIARMFNGGGHATASGGRTDLDTLKVILEGKFYVE